MEYIIIVILQFAGFGLHTTKKIGELDAANPDVPISEIKKIFWEKEWYTFISSAFILLLSVTIVLSIDLYAKEWKTSIGAWYYLGAFVMAAVLGWGGQEFAYRLFGKTQVYIEKKFDKELEVK